MFFLLLIGYLIHIQKKINIFIIYRIAVDYNSTSLLNIDLLMDLIFGVDILLKFNTTLPLRSK